MEIEMVRREERHINPLPKIRNRYRYKVKDTTYILGARCKDGVLLAGDTKVIRGQTEVDSEEKIFKPIEGVLVGASGITGLFDKFLEEITIIAKQRIETGSYTTIQFIEDCEDLLKTISGRYIERIRDSLELLVAFRSGKIAQLYNVSDIGFSEAVKKYRVIGHGEPYGSQFLHYLWEPEKSMLDVAKLVCFIVAFIQHLGLDNSVGKPCTFWIIPDIPDDISEKISNGIDLEGEEIQRITIRKLEGVEMTEVMKNVDEEISKMVENILNIKL